MDASEATQSQLVRAAQKDEYFLTQLKSQVAETLQKIIGIQWWIKHYREVQLMVDVAYFALTTILGNQTLGEEYVNIIQVDNTLRRVPSLQRRLLWLLLHTSGSYFAEKWLSKYENNLLEHHTLFSNFPKVKTILQRILPLAQHILDFLHRCHLVIFYFQGRFYHIPKRIMSIRHLPARSWLGGTNSYWGYQVLGWLSVIQLGISMALLAHRFYTHNIPNMVDGSNAINDLHESDQSQKDAHLRCHLCLERRHIPTATPCGHLFCWKCIHNWIESKPQCPICRECIEPSRIIRLHNFE